VKKQPDLVVDILERLAASGVLDRILLIGSWCAQSYRQGYFGPDYAPEFKTRDIDFLVSRKQMFLKELDLEALMKPLGFDLDFHPSGLMKLESAELAIEFLVPEVGSGTDRPFPIKALKFNAQPLRHLAMLWRQPIFVEVSGIRVRLPHPADFCLQKFIVAQVRQNRPKRAKDLSVAETTLEALLARGETKTLRSAYDGLSRSEKKMVRPILLERGVKIENGM